MSGDKSISVGNCFMIIQQGLLKADFDELSSSPASYAALAKKLGQNQESLLEVRVPPFRLSVFKFRATRLIIDSRYAPGSQKTIETKNRCMFVRGVRKDEPTPMRAYSEPIQDFGRF